MTGVQKCALPICLQTVLSYNPSLTNGITTPATIANAASVSNIISIVAITVDSAFGSAIDTSSTYQLLSGRLWFLNAGTTATGIFKYYDYAT